MIREISFFATAIMISTPAVEAYAQQETVEHDLQCFLVISQLLEAEEEEAKLSGMLASVFFMGKIFGRDPNIDLEGALEAAAREFDESHTARLLSECGAEDGTARFAG